MTLERHFMKLNYNKKSYIHLKNNKTSKTVFERKQSSHFFFYLDNWTVSFKHFVTKSDKNITSKIINSQESGDMYSTIQLVQHCLSEIFNNTAFNLIAE